MKARLYAASIFGIYGAVISLLSQPSDNVAEHDNAHVAIWFYSGLASYDLEGTGSASHYSASVDIPIKANFDLVASIFYIDTDQDLSVFGYDNPATHDYGPVPYMWLDFQPRVSYSIIEDGLDVYAGLGLGLVYDLRSEDWIANDPRLALKPVASIGFVVSAGDHLLIGGGSRARGLASVIGDQVVFPGHSYEWFLGIGYGM